MEQNDDTDTGCMEKCCACLGCVWNKSQEELLERVAGKFPHFRTKETLVKVIEILQLTFFEEEPANPEPIEGGEVVVDV